MRVVRRLLKRLINSVARRDDQRWQEEIEEHLARQTEENLRAGIPPAEARRLARLKFGAVAALRDDYHDEHRLPILENLLQDLRYALRQMRKSPAFTLLTALILTLGIGINTAIFSLVYHILLEPLPFPQAKQLYAVWARSDSQQKRRIAASGPDFLDYQDQSRSFTHVAELIPYFTEAWTGDGDPKVIRCTGVSEGFFSVLGVRPYLGRFYTASEYADLHNPTMLVSYRFWKSQLGGDPHVLGRIIHLGGGPNTIVGVVPPLPDLFPDTDVWPELTTRPSWEFMKWRRNKFLTVIGRLKPGVTASAEMALRLSLGAGQRRLRQQLLTEDLVLSVIASSPGVLAAWAALQVLPRLSSLGLPRLEGVSLSGTALLMTVGIAILTTLLFGWAPSLLFSGLDLASSLRTGRTHTGKSHNRSFSTLIVAEIACSMVLTICAGLLLHSYWRLAHVDSGFEADHMMTTYLRTTYYGPEGRSFRKDVLAGVGSLPGVRAAAVADCTPGRRASIATLLFNDGPDDPDHPARAQGCWASPEFFRVSGTPLRRGRVFNSRDQADSAPVVIVNEQTARQYWPREDPIGKFIGVNYTGPGRVGGSTLRMREIVGVVQGMKYEPPDSPTEPAVYRPYLQDETYHDLAR